MKHSRRYKQFNVDPLKEYLLEEGVKAVKENATVKFDETVDIAVRLGVDPRKADQIIRGTVALPHGTGKTQRVLVLTRTKEKEAEEAGADYFGNDEYIKKIKDGWLEMDVVIATPDMMGDIGKAGLGRILGPRGLMPNPKSGTVTQDITDTVKEVKAGRIEFRVDKYGILHVPMGKISFDNEKLLENIRKFISQVLSMRPATAKGQYILGVSLSSTMGPGVKIDRFQLISSN